ncbi:MAG TPA: DUF1844 domain-containing protein [Blastocatellia bacterium]|nr:DUF1844 domain-containing protein [Blastocatellia bacterium]
MPNEKDSTFKVTDRRKFNADGTPREETSVKNPLDPSAAAPPEAAAEAPARTNQPSTPASAQARSDNVVSFPPPQAEAQSETRSESARGGVTSASAASAAEPAARQSARTPQHDAVEQSYSKASAAQPSDMPPATFLSLVNMLGVEAAMHLGMVQMPGQEEPPSIDLPAARHMIDLLALLQTKTKGNLTADEENLMEGLLADLRMQFVSLSKRR